jgi:tetratricopeptide (TPR) repeat protein
VGKVLGIKENLVEIQRKYAYDLLIRGDLEGCINTCDYLLRLPAKDENARKEVRSFSLTNQATCLKKMGKFEEALSKTEEAMTDCCKDDFYKAVFTRALIRKAKGDKDKAETDLNDTIKWYRKNEMYYELAKALDVKADLLKDENLFLEAIENYKLAEKEADWNHINREKFIKEVDNVHHRLIELYIYNAEHNMIKAYQTLNNIKGEKTREEATKKVKNLFRKEV